jgi:hypothetical protein
VTRGLIRKPNPKTAFDFIIYQLHSREGHPRENYIIAGLSNGPYNNMTNKIYNTPSSPI